MEALEEFEPVIGRIYDYAAAAGLPLDTLIHETGTAQLEINFLHGDALPLADQVLLFKRSTRQAAQQGRHACDLHGQADRRTSRQLDASPHVGRRRGDGSKLFAGDDDADTEMFGHFIGGLQKYMPEVMPLFAPNVNSFRRIRPNHSAPANIEWSHDNRSCGLRVPAGGRAARRVENRLPGADANPYLAIAGSLLAGYLGVEEKLERSAEASGNAYSSKSTLPKTMEEALDRFAACEPVRALLGERFRPDLSARQERRARPVPERRDALGTRPPAAQGVTVGVQFRSGHRQILLCRHRQSGAEPSGAAGRRRRRSGGGRRRLHRPVRRPSCRRARAEGGAARRRQDRLGRIGPQWRPDHPRPAQGRQGAGKLYGPERARALFDLAFEARGLVLDLIERHAIDCDLRLTGHLVGAVNGSDMARSRRRGRVPGA